MTTTPDRITDRILGPRDTVVVGGSDAQSYLQSQIAQTLDGLEIGESRWSFVLDPTGKIVSLARVARRADDEFVLDTDVGFGQLLLDRLNRFKLRVDVELTLETGDDAPVDAAVERERVEAGWPRMGAEIVPDKTIVGGTGLAPIAVCFTKGCYPGQELVERMDSRGAEGPTTLRRVSAPAGASVGDPVVVDGNEIGTYTTVAGDLALAWVTRGTDAGEPIQF